MLNADANKANTNKRVFTEKILISIEYFPIKPTVNGIPAIDIKNIVIANAKKGSFLANPSNISNPVVSDFSDKYAMIENIPVDTNVYPIT